MRRELKVVIMAKPALALVPMPSVQGCVAARCAFPPGDSVAARWGRIPLCDVLVDRQVLRLFVFALFLAEAGRWIGWEPDY